MEQLALDDNQACREYLPDHISLGKVGLLINLVFTVTELKVKVNIL